MIDAYPLRLQPFVRDYIWGGRRLQTVLGKDLPKDGVWAESWEIVDHPEHSSQITNGPLAGKTLAQIAVEHRDWLYGQDSQLRSLPLLLKYLDCQRVLSVQVHPQDSYAAHMNPPDLGKTEAWFIVSAEPDALLYAGLKPGVDRAELERQLAAGQVDQCLQAIKAQPGDCIFIPAGTVHALGAGLVVAEIQQASNTTFRLFDWNRMDASGQPRPLHIAQSMEVIDFESGPRQFQVPEESGEPGRQRLVACDKFVLDRLQVAPSGEEATLQTFKLAGDGRFHLITVPGGRAILRWGDQCQEVSTGQSLLLPASLSQSTVELGPGTTLLDMYLPD
jgi:mannose-6-phosphate isomerase